ncbi:NB-ARC domain-containing protein [Amycolatopsis sp. NPDC049252]|uniref:NB-ARC domain-containing protein n=1 Tax=Amycolatopsis sp. NPDC049252 TaxID=3363933 RepID=UPI003712881B
MSETVTGFAKLLEELLVCTGMSRRQLARKAARHESTVGDLFAGKGRRLPQWDLVYDVVTAAINNLPTTVTTVGADRLRMLRDQKWWRDQYDELQKHLDADSRPRAEVAVRTDESDPEHPVGRPTADLAVRKPAGGLTVRSWRDRMPYSTKQYARRQELHDRIKLAVSENCRIALVGLPGFGKTHLASTVSAEMAEQMRGEALWLRGDSADQMVKSIKSELHVRGRRHDFDDARLLREFADLVDTSPKPLAVLIDDLDDPELLERVLPDALGTPVIVTMRRRRVDPGVWTCITIDELSAEQAFVLARAELRGPFSDSDAQRLATVLAGYPLAIESAAALLRNHYITLDEFCAGLERDIERTLSIGEQRDKALTFIYRSLLSRLEESDFAAARLLAVIAFLRQNHVARHTLQGIFRAIPSVAESAPADSYDPMGFADAIARLTEYSFVSMIGEDDIGMHELVRELVNKLALDRHEVVGAAAAAWLRDKFEGERPFFGPTDEQLGLVNTVIDAVGEHRANDDHTELLGQLLVAAMEQGSWSGRAILKKNWLFRRALRGSGRIDPQIAALQYRLLMVEEQDHDPLILANLGGSRYLGSSMTPERMAATVNQPWATHAVDRGNLKVSHRKTEITRLIEPLPESLSIARDAMRKGDLDLAHVYASRPLQESAPPPVAARAHLLLTRLALRRPNLPKAVHHITELRRLNAAGTATDGSKMPNVAHVDLLEGEIAYAQFVAGERLNDARPFFERARDRFSGELFGLGRFEVARRIGTMRVFDEDLGKAVESLRATLAATAYPLLMPVHYRTAVSLTKIGIIAGKVPAPHLDDCRRAAEFFSSSPAYDRYWYAEALFVLELAENLAAKQPFAPLRDPTDGPTSLRRAAEEELKTIGRQDKIDLMRTVKRSVDARPLLLD